MNTTKSRKITNKQKLSKASVLTLSLILCLLVLTACTNGATGEAEQNSPEAQVTDTAPTVTPTAIPASEPTPAFEAEPTATETPSPEPTATPEPTLTPEQQEEKEAAERKEKALKPTKGEVSFSRAGYFFTESFDLELLLDSEKKGVIRYTLDGTEPTKNSTLYEDPITVPEITADTLDIGFVIRAKAFYEDGTESADFSHTYFVAEDIDERFTTLVISIIGDDKELREGPRGIMYGDNYSARGMKSERKVRIECIDTCGEKVFSQLAGVRIFGAGSREHEIKSLKLFARKDYDPEHGSFKIDSFGTLDVNGELIKKYDKLVLRNAGDDFLGAFLRDELSSRLVEQAGFSDYEAVVPAVCFINGEYYALYWLHEVYCDKYFQKKYGESDGEYVVLEGSDRTKSQSGDKLEVQAAREYNEIYSKYMKADLTDDAAFNELCSLIDVENYMDYMCYNICIGNADWPQGNYRCYRYYANDGVYDEEGPRDGRYRFLMHDSDCGYAMWRTNSYAGANINDFAAVIGDRSQTRYSPLLTRLMEREDCRAYFYGKAWEFINTVLSSENVERTLDLMCKEREEELPNYISRLRAMGLDVSMDSVERNITRIRSFIKNRPQFFEEWIGEYKPSGEEEQ